MPSQQLQKLELGPEKVLKTRHLTDVSTLKSKSLPIFPEPDYMRYRNFSAVEIFELFWDHSLLESIIDQMAL